MQTRTETPLAVVDGRLAVAAQAWRRAQAGGAAMVADALYREVDRLLGYRQAVAAGLVTITEER